MELHNRINLDNQCVWLVIKKKSVTMHGNMNVQMNILGSCEIIH
jgi:hypothetical protein